MCSMSGARAKIPAAALIDEASHDCDLSSRDTALLQALVYGVLRHRNLLDRWAELLADKKELDRETLGALRLGLVQLLVLDMAPHAAVNETVEHAGRAGALVNAVLRRALREKDALYAARDAAPCTSASRSRSGWCGAGSSSLARRKRPRSAIGTSSPRRFTCASTA